MSDRIIQHYNLIKKLGEGGMGEVWRAVDTRLARPVALKLLPRSFIYDDEARCRFLREARAASALNHPNIITVYETGEADGQPYMAMELIEGESVREMIDRGPIPGDKAFDIVKQALAGLAEAHRAGIIHRDIKPANLMIRTDGFVKILDFGLAKIMDAADTLSLTTGIIGTPRYMSPEQAMGRPVDARSDIFSLGAVFYEMLSGKHAFQGNNLHEILSKITGPDLPPPQENISREIEGLICKSLQKSPDGRYPGAGEMLTDLVALTSGSFELHHSLPEEETSLLVLPFSTDESDRDLADGVTDELIERISRVERIRVMSRGTSFRYRDVECDLKSLGQELNVKLFLTGRFRRSGERAKVIAQLVNARDDFQVWSDRFQFQIHDDFDAEEEISSAIVGSLRKHFTGKAQDTRDQKHEEAKKAAALTSTAREYYLNGLYLFNSFREEDLFKAIGFFEKAVETDPEFVTARAKLSEAYTFAFFYEQGRGEEGMLTRGLQEANKALEIDPDNPDAHVSLGLVDLARGKLPAAREKFRKAILVSPNHPDALSWFSYFNTITGNPEYAGILARRAIQRDPQNTVHYIWLGLALISQGRFMEALECLDRTVRLDPRNPYPFALLQFCNLALGREEEARILHDYLGEFAENQYSIRLIQAIYRVKRGDEDVEISEKDLEEIRLSPEDSRFAADFYALKGDRDMMMDMLFQSIQNGHLNPAFLETDPFLNDYRQDAEFLTIQKELRLLLDKINKSYSQA